MKPSRWTPYLLLLPSLLYLALFFVYPMTQAFQLAFTREGQYLNLRAEADSEAATTGILPLQTVVSVTDRIEADETLPSGATRPIFWFKIQGETEAGETVEGWVNQRSVFIENRRTSETARVTGGEATREWTFDHVNRMITDF